MNLEKRRQHNLCCLPFLKTTKTITNLDSA